VMDPNREEARLLRRMCSFVRWFTQPIGKLLLLALASLVRSLRTRRRRCGVLDHIGDAFAKAGRLRWNGGERRLAPLSYFCTC
jgi:hypothetical protein